MRIIATALLCIATLGLQAQTAETTKAKPFKHLDLAVEVGTTGVGIDFATPVAKNVKVRMGFTYMPKFESTIHFPFQVGEDASEDVQTERFNTLTGILNDFTGFEVDREVDMTAKATFWNFKLLVDVYPFNNKHWRVTGGFYLGPSKIGEAYNTTEEMTTLVSVGMYNNIWLKSANGEPLYQDMYVDAIQNKVLEYGRMYSQQGYINGTDEMNTLEPDDNGMMKAKATVNSFRPYLGFGYEFDFGKEKQYSFGVDAGVMFWGGHPGIKTQNSYYYEEEPIDPNDEKLGYTMVRKCREVDLTRDVYNLPDGKVKDLTDVIKKVTAYPVINVRIAKKLF